MVVLCSTGFLPFYDYYQWLFQGHVVAVLLFGADPGSSAIADAYSLSPVPVPNLAAPVVIGLLDTVLPTEVAGQVFIVVTVLGFACAFGHLVRTIQQRPTAVEFLGFPWAMGFFLYKGYLSYAFGLAVMFLLVAMLHRLTQRPAGDHRRTLLAVAGVGVLLYLSHLLAWIMGGLAVLVYALVLARQGRRRTAGQLVAAQSPAAVLAVWYLLAEHGGSGITLYPSWQDKAIALTETLQFFLRSDPFPPALPLFWVNVALALAFVGIVLSRLDVRAIGTAVSTRPVLWLSAALAAVALLLPISTVNDLIKPDERFVAPALLLAAAALPYRPGRLRVTALGPVFAAAVVALHLVEYVDVGQRIARVDAATDAAVPAATDVLRPDGAVPVRLRPHGRAGHRRAGAQVVRRGPRPRGRTRAGQRRGDLAGARPPLHAPGCHRAHARRPRGGHRRAPRRRPVRRGRRLPVRSGGGSAGAGAALPVDRRRRHLRDPRPHVAAERPALTRLRTRSRRPLTAGEEPRPIVREAEGDHDDRERGTTGGRGGCVRADDGLPA